MSYSQPPYDYNINRSVNYQSGSSFNPGVNSGYSSGYDSEYNPGSGYDPRYGSRYDPRYDPQSIDDYGDEVRKHTSSGRIIIIILFIIIILGILGFAVWWFFFHEKSTSKKGTYYWDAASSSWLGSFTLNNSNPDAVVYLASGSNTASTNSSGDVAIFRPGTGSGQTFPSGFTPSPAPGGSLNSQGGLSVNSSYTLTPQGFSTLTIDKSGNISVT